MLFQRVSSLTVINALSLLTASLTTAGLDLSLLMKLHLCLNNSKSKVDFYQSTTGTFHSNTGGIKMHDFTPQYPALKRYAKSLVRAGEDADDLLQDTFVKLLKYSHLFDGKYPTAWASTIMRNILFTQRRRAWRQQPLGDYDIPLPPPPSAELADIIALLRALPSHQLKTFLRVVAGESYRDVAHAMDIAEGTVKSRAMRIRTRLNGPVNPALRPPPGEAHDALLEMILAAI